jgi:hypothetical protein
MNTADPADEVARSEAVQAEAEALMRLGAERPLSMRLTGSLAVRAHCPVHAPLLAALGISPAACLSRRPAPGAPVVPAA